MIIASGCSFASQPVLAEHLIGLVAALLAVANGFEHNELLPQEGVF